MRNFNKALLILTFCMVFILIGCGTKKDVKQETSFKIDYEKYTLANGLEVILHEDKSDPITAVAIQYHVGSNREEKGKTGFAHLFEHMMFQESQHVGQDQFFKKIQGAGGTLNGGTGNDGTTYFEVVPKNALEMVLWMEADRLGFLGSTVTKEAFINQQGVVMNEKRQTSDNRPYGQTRYILGKLLYPDGHPYNWQVIGSMEDLSGATLEDVHGFHQKWYRTNNATMVVAGDFDKEQTKKWIEKYFGEIKGGEKQDDPKPQHVTLEATKSAYYEDKMARAPEINIIFPTINQYTPDAYALRFLGQLFGSGKKSPLYKVIVEEKKLAPRASAYQRSQEITGNFSIRIRTFPGKNLTEVKNAVFEAFEKFEKDSFTQKDLDQFKASIETGFYNRISSILGKSFTLARYNEYTGSPDFISKDLENTLAITKEDVLRVYNKYIKGKNYVMTSFVPKGQANLIVEGAELFEIPKDPVVSADQLKERVKDYKVEKVTSAFDRSVEPTKGPDPTITIPAVWKDNYSNGIKFYGIQHKELPLSQFSITIKGGGLLDKLEKVGVANLITDMLMQGTKTKTPIELEDAIKELGAFINVYTGRESITLTANCLSSKINAVYALCEEILLSPRWDEVEFKRVKEETLTQILRNKSNPNVLAANQFNKLVYGEQHLFGLPLSGTENTVKAITLEDLKAYYEESFSPSITHISYVGSLDKDEILKTFKSLEGKWQTKDVKIPIPAQPAEIQKSQVYFVNLPGARQSVIYIGAAALPQTHADYYPAVIMNYRLGGSFNSIVNMILREEKGYTYGARASFRGSQTAGTFIASSSVQANTTLESSQIFRDSMVKYREGISEQDLGFTQNAMIKSNTRAFETLGSLVGMLNNIANYNLADDYVKEREAIVQGMTLDKIKELAQKYIHPDKMFYIVVGDAKAHMASLKELGFGDPILIESK